MESWRGGRDTEMILSFYLLLFCESGGSGGQFAWLMVALHLSLLGEVWELKIFWDKTMLFSIFYLKIVLYQYLAQLLFPIGEARVLWPLAPPPWLHHCAAGCYKSAISLETCSVAINNVLVIHSCFVTYLVYVEWFRNPGKDKPF